MRRDAAMVILHTAHEYPPTVGGVAEVVSQVSVRLTQRGHEVHVASGWGRGLAKEEVLQGVCVHRFDVQGNAVRGMSGEVRRYVEFVEAFLADVLVVHYAPSWPLDALLPHLRELPAAQVFVGHGLARITDPAYRDYFNALGVALRHVDRVVALSALLEEVPFCRQHGITEPSIIPNGVDSNVSVSARRGVRKRWGIGDRPWLVSASNHSGVKGHHRLFEVVRGVRRDLPEATATIIGNPYPAEKWRLGRIGVRGGCWYRCRLQAAVAPAVSLRWNVPRADVISAIQEADVVLIGSSYEGSPLVVLESMAAGTPWVSFDVGCVREHTGGLIVQDSEEMARAVAYLLNDAQASAELGEQGRRRARERHDWEALVQCYEQVYAEAVASKAAKRS